MFSFRGKIFGPSRGPNLNLTVAKLKAVADFHGQFTYRVQVYEGAPDGWKEEGNHPFPEDARAYKELGLK